MAAFRRIIQSPLLPWVVLLILVGIWVWYGSPDQPAPPPREQPSPEQNPSPEQAQPQPRKSRNGRQAYWRTQVADLVIERVARGQLSLLEAAAWIRQLYPRPKIESGGNSVLYYCRQVLLRLDRLRSEGKLSDDPEVFRFVRAEYQRLKREPDTVVLPEPPVVPGMPPCPDGD